VGRLLQNRARDRNGVDDVLQSGDRADVSGMVHDDGIQGHMAVPVGIAAEADGVVGHVGLRNLRSRLDHVEARAARDARLDRLGVGGGAEVPGGHDDSRGGRVGSGGSGGSHRQT
jgi:hypothetical protein